MGCPIPGCTEAHKNQFEHYATAMVSTRVSTSKKVALEPKVVSTPVSTKPSKYEKVKAWREKNREKYNASMRAGRRKLKYDNEEEGT